MPERSARKLIRPPFPIDQSSDPPALSPERQDASDANNYALAEVATQKAPAVLPETSRKNALAETETQQLPIFRPISSLSNTGWFRVMAQYARSPRKSSLAPSPDADKPGKRKRPALSRRRKRILLIAAALLLLPSIILVVELVSSLLFYRQLQDGIAHLETAGNTFRGTSGGSMENYFNPDKWLQASTEIKAAHADFSAVSDALDHEGGVALASFLFPEQIHTARSLGHIAMTGTDVAEQLLQTMQDIAPSVAPALAKNASTGTDAPLTPYLTPASYQKINTTLDAIAPQIHSIAQDAQGISLDSLPISSKQRATVAALLPLLPTLDTVFSQEHSYQAILGWFLGIDGQRSFLVEPMDSSELRATGGFTGQFGELVLNGGHVGPMKLANIGKYEEDHSSEGDGSLPDPVVYPKVQEQKAPAPYSDWWPIENFGLRDANLSADFPTSAQIAMDRYTYEFDHPLDGVIVFGPALIKHVLHVTGPIFIPVYNQTITDQNLEDILHYYQLDNTAIRQETIIENVSDTQVARKLFTQRVTQALISTVSHLPVDKLFALAGEMFQSMKTKDLEIYVTNPQLEAFLGKYGSTASLDRSTTHDGLFVVQSNLSASKASQYVTTTFQDTVELDEQGGATHHLQMTLDYQQKGDVYGFDTYRDYVRIYVPTGSRLLSGNGFDQYDRPYCGDTQSSFRPLCQADVYGDGSLVCKPPVTIGYATSYIDDPYVNEYHPLDVTGPPQNQTSDEEGRAMFGGWVVIPKNCTMTVTLSWYVPPLSQQSYHLLLQAQSNVYSMFTLTVQPSGSTCNQSNGLHITHSMDGEDSSFTLKQQGSTCSLVSP